MTIRNLDRLLQPASVALIGARTRAGSIGLKVAQNLIEGGFKGPIGFVNPKRPMLLGRQAVARVEELGFVPDLAIIATPPETIAELVADLGRLGTRACVVISAGFDAETRRRMLEAGRPHLMRVQGPNCLGLLVPPLGLNASFAHRHPLAGDIAFLSQSGALVTAMVDWAADHRVGFSHIVSLGDMADADFGDFLDYLAQDRASRAILIYMEGLTSARKFISAARRAARAKPVIVVKSGRRPEGAKAASSHTGALAGSDAAYDAAFRRTGLLRVDDLDELLVAAEMLSRAPRFAGERLAILTNGGGAGVLAADLLSDSDGRLAELAPETIVRLNATLPSMWSHGNPVDIIGDAPPERFLAGLDALMEDPGTDAVLVMDCPTALASATDIATRIVARVGERRQAGLPVKPLMTNWLGAGSAEPARAVFGEAKIPTFETPGAAVHGFMQMVRYNRAQEQLMRTPSAAAGALKTDRAAAQSILDAARHDGREMLNEVEAKQLIAAYGIPVTQTLVARDPAEAGACAAQLLSPDRKPRPAAGVVIKILSEDITHKSDVGGVRLNLASPREAEKAAQHMLEAVKTARPDARLQGFTVQPMIRRAGGYELIVGMSDDATFGPVIMFGAGGAAVEVMKDTALALPPLDDVLARDLIRQTRISRLLEGYRDQPRAAIEAIEDCLVRIGLLVTHHPEVLELDINPLVADASGVIALDARVRIGRTAKIQRRPMAIRPYPSQWETRVTLPGEAALGELTLRPVRPDDEDRIKALIGKLSVDDTRLRFFTPKVDTSHRSIARLTQLDYAREIAFAAVTADGDEILGVSRLAADPDYVAAEYSVVVRSDLKGHGLGWRLMQQIIDYAKSEGLKVIHGSVLAENTTMLRMCADLGFKVEVDEEDRMVRKVELRLG